MCVTNKQSTELVTIGLSVYNAEKYIDYAINSILNQSYDNWELILTDDGSTDASIEAIRKYLYDRRIRLIVDKNNKGLPFRLNQQINLATGKYFARMDADDIMHPERIERQVKYMEANTHIDVVGSPMYLIDDNNCIYGVTKILTYPSALNDVFYERCFVHVSVMAKLVWYKNNPYDTSQIRMEDKGLWARTIMKSKFANLQTPLMYCRNIGIPDMKKRLRGMKPDIALIQNTFSEKHLIKLKFVMIFFIKLFAVFLLTIIRQKKMAIKRKTFFISDQERQKAIIFLQKAIVLKNAKDALGR